MNPARLAVVDDDPAFAELSGDAAWIARLRCRCLLERHGAAPGAEPHAGARRGPARRADAEHERARDAKALRVGQPELPVIMLSGQQVPNTIVDAVRLGAVDYVVKPDDAEELGEAALEIAIRSALEQVALDERSRAAARAGVGRRRTAMQPCWGDGSAMRHVLDDGRARRRQRRDACSSPARAASARK